MISRWNGKHWTNVSGPKSDLLYAMSVSPTDDVWAGGAMPVSDGEDEAYADHWSGHKWIGMVLPYNAVGGALPDELFGIAAISSTDALAVGNGGYAAKWDGKQWSVVDIPRGANPIAAVSATDVWAAGDAIEHWNGASWRAAPFTLPANWHPAFASVSAVGPNDV